MEVCIIMLLHCHNVLDIVASPKKTIATVYHTYLTWLCVYIRIQRSISHSVCIVRLKCFHFDKYCIKSVFYCTVAIYHCKLQMRCAVFLNA